MWLPLYGATSCARSYRWSGRSRQPSLQRLARWHRLPDCSAATNEWRGKEFRGKLTSATWRATVVLEPGSRNAAFVTFIHNKLADIARILHIVVPSSSTPEQLYYIGLKCILIVFFLIRCLCRYFGIDCHGRPQRSPRLCSRSFRSSGYQRGNRRESKGVTSGKGVTSV